MRTTADVEKTQAPMDERAQLEHELRQHRLRQESADRCAIGAAGCLEPQRPMSPEEIVAEFFRYHAPNELTIPKYAAINQAAKNFAEVVMANCPPGADRADAIRKIREARMTANAAIALNGLSLY